MPNNIYSHNTFEYQNRQCLYHIRMSEGIFSSRLPSKFRAARVQKTFRWVTGIFYTEKQRGVKVFVSFQRPPRKTLFPPKKTVWHNFTRIN